MADTRSMAERIEELRKRKAHNEAGGGEKRLEKQRASGKKTARDRIADLVDGESFEEIGLFAENRTTLFGMAEADMPRRCGDGYGQCARPPGTHRQPGLHRGRWVRW